MFFRHLGTVMESLAWEMGQEGPGNGTVQLVAQGEEKAAVAHAIIAVGSFNVASTTVSGYLNVARDGRHRRGVEPREAPNTAGWQCAGLAQRATFTAVVTTWKWRARAEAAGTTVNVGNLAIAVLQLEATPMAARRRYMARAG